MFFTFKEVAKSIVLEANPKLSKEDVDKIVSKYAHSFGMR